MMELVVGKQLLDLVRAAYKADLPVLIEGVHGVGKSELLLQAARELGVECTVLDLSLCEPIDLVGLPIIEDRRTEFASPAFLPTDGAGLLVLEEINRAPRHVLAPCLQLLTARVLNQYKLPAGWLPVACTNPSDEDTDGARYQVGALDPALLSRFISVRAKPGLSEWLSWAQANEVHEAVVDAVTDAGIEALTKAEGNPRAWSYASDFLKAWDDVKFDDQVLFAALVGVLGDRWGMVLAQCYGAGGEQQLAATEILENFAGVRPTLDRWCRQRRVDLVRASWEALQRHLSANMTAKSVVANVTFSANLQSFIERLPADLRNSASLWWGDHASAFATPSGAPSRSTLGRGRPHGR